MKMNGTRRTLARLDSRAAVSVGARLVTLVATCLLTLCMVWPSDVWAQNATLSGVVRDPHGSVVAAAHLELVDQATGIASTATSNAQGVYVFSSLRPSTYRLTVEAPGFAVFKQSDLALFVDARVGFNATLAIAAQSETVEVSERAPLLGTTDGSVGTVIDRELAARLPVRGRSFSAMVALAPGVTRAGTYSSSSSTAGSEFSTNGQRDTSNALLVDGVSGMSELGQAGLAAGAGTKLASTQTGSVNGGVSLDAVQEIHVQTSTFAAEFGRTPGAQIALVTRSGSNRFTGSLFEQFRDNRMIANDWFANNRGVAKPRSKEHQFGGTLGGPILTNRLFFFGSYEGLRLQRPSFQTIGVPSAEARTRPGALGALLALYPAPTAERGGLVAEYAAFDGRRYSSDTLGVRVDGSIRPGVQAFVRYASSPSFERNDQPIPSITSQEKDTYGVTGSLTAALSNKALLEVRGNVGRSTFDYLSETDGLRAWLPSGFPDDRQMIFSIGSLSALNVGPATGNVQRQANVVSAFSYLWGNHQLKTGIDYRRINPALGVTRYAIAQVNTLQGGLDTNRLDALTNIQSPAIHGTFQNVSFYAQDSWRAGQRLSLTYGLRWDINPSPTFREGEGPLAALTFAPVSELTVATTQNRPLWKTNYGNVLPRIGASYSIDQRGTTHLSGGFGLFGDLEGAATGNGQLFSNQTTVGVALPLTNDDFAILPPPSFTTPIGVTLVVADPNLQTPRVAQWNATLQRVFGANYAVSAAYVGAEGLRLLQTHHWRARTSPTFNTNFLTVSTDGRSTYHSLQVQFRGRPTRRLSILGSYTYGRAKDTVSTNSGGDPVDELTPSTNDLRHSASVAIAWSLPRTQRRAVGWLVNDWDLDAMAFARSAYPLTLFSARLQVPTGVEVIPLRLSQVPGVPVTIDDPTAPGGWRFNPDAFKEPLNGQQGDTTRNQFRGFSSAQVDMALQRSVSLAGFAKVRIRVDVFNVFNTPEFAQPYPNYDTFFGRARTMRALGIAALYQPGGPRSATVSVRFQF